jgi:hypothetical protein
LETLPEKGGMLETSYCIQKRCPGFSMPEEQETLLAGYVKPGEVEMTVQEWTEKNENKELVEEKQFYLSEVIPTWIAERKKLEALGIPTKLDPKEICWNNQRFYSPPRPPENLDNDHEIIMRWLKALKAMPGLVFQSVTALNAICQQRGAMPTNEEEERAKDFYLGSIKKIMQGEETVSQERANVIPKK